MSIEKISVFGLGKLGATMVGCFAASGLRVVGVDLQESVVDAVAAGQSPVPEPGLQDLYDKHRGRITATRDPESAVQESDTSFIIVPTPSMPDGEFFTTIAARVAESIGKALRGKKDYHLIVLTSTVLPGATERDVKTALENASGKTCGKDFGLCYSPEFIAIGDVVNGLLNPDFFLIGEFDEKSGDLLDTIYQKMAGVHSKDGKANNQAPIIRMSIVDAELTKIAINSYVTMKISFANTLARICDKLPGADAHVVARAVGKDKRIGSKYLTPGAAFGGPCFPRDNRALSWLAGSLDAEAPLAEATDVVNRRQIDFLVKMVISCAPQAQTIGLLGLSYKPRTNLMEESQAVDMARRFIGRGLRVVAYDPWALKHGATEDIEGLELVDSASQCIAASDVVVLATTHEEFEELTPKDFERDGRLVSLVDVWGFLRERGFDGLPKYIVPGVCRGTGDGGQ